MLLTDLQIFASSSGLGSLGVSGSAFLIELITFILGYLVLRKWAFGPILKVLKERRDTIAKGVNLGQEMTLERQKLEEKVAKELAEARTKADGIMAAASEEAKDLVHQAEGQAATKAELIINEAKEQTKQDINRAKRQLEGEIVSLVSEATEVLTTEKVDTKKDAGLIHKALAGRVSTDG